MHRRRNIAASSALRSASDRLVSRPFMKVFVLIPALNPCSRMLGVIDELLQRDAAVEIMVVNDGSARECEPLFHEAAARLRVDLLHHAQNLGKGAALRTGIQRFLQRADADDVLITADADGQHLPADILAVAAVALKNPSSLVLGTRAFSGDVPLRSRFGNDLTRLVFRLFTGQRLTDTQTGLRAIPRDLLEKLLAVKTNRYAFELEMLLIASRARILLITEAIQTVYLQDNSSSHFRPLVDSARIYWVFVRYLLG